MVMDGQIVTENVRRYRAIASLCRQTAALRPLQKWSLLDQAEGWERLAAEEAYFIVCNSRDGDEELEGSTYAEAAWEFDGCGLSVRILPHYGLTRRAVVPASNSAMMPTRRIDHIS